ncbi:hypothetical protein ACRAWD_25345 [Caulobacter segnis]
MDARTPPHKSPESAVNQTRPAADPPDRRPRSASLDRPGRWPASCSSREFTGAIISWDHESWTTS